MTLLEAIPLRHSVRKYLPTPLSESIIRKLNDEITRINLDSGLHIQLVSDEPRAFRNLFAYGSFSQVKNYFIIAGKKSEQLEELAGYYGEQLVLFAQTLGLNTCWVGLSYKKVAGTYTLSSDEKIICYIALGYGLNQGFPHKTKTPQMVSNISDSTPAWFARGVEAALLAPSAINQQKFRFNYKAPSEADRLPLVETSRGFSLAGYTKVDLGIAKLHFELAAGSENFRWAHT